MEIRMPKLGVAVDAGTLVEWLVSDGDQVEAGDVLFLLATDKVESQVEAPTNGTIKLMAEADQDYPVGTLLAVLE